MQNYFLWCLDAFYILQRCFSFRNTYLKKPAVLVMSKTKRIREKLKELLLSWLLSLWCVKRFFGLGGNL